MSEGERFSYYDGIAEGYSQLHKEEQIRKLELVARFIPKDASILDVGCGTGFSKFLGQVVGIDPSRKLLSQAKMPTIQGVGERLPFKDYSFDVVICISALHNFADYRKGVAEMGRVSRKIVIISLFRKARAFGMMEKEIREALAVEQVLGERHDDIYICRKRGKDDKGSVKPILTDKIY